MQYLSVIQHFTFNGVLNIHYRVAICIFYMVGNYTQLTEKKLQSTRCDIEWSANRCSLLDYLFLFVWQAYTGRYNTTEHAYHCA